jgi:hypothetical protein
VRADGELTAYASKKTSICTATHQGKHEIALLLIDVIKDFDFPEADRKYARPMARNLPRLNRRGQKAGVPIIYVNVPAIFKTFFETLSRRSRRKR